MVSPIQGLASLTYLATLIVVCFMVCLIAIYQRKEVKAVAGRTWIWGLIPWLLTLPSAYFAFHYADYSSYLESTDLPPILMRSAEQQFRLYALGGAAVGGFFGALYHSGSAAVTEVIRPGSFLAKQKNGYGWSLAIGASAAVISALLFSVAEVGAGVGQELSGMAYTVSLTTPAVVLLVTLPQMLAAAVTEELVFRGVLQTWLGRFFGGLEQAHYVAIAASSFLWSCGHALNTDSFALKFIQIFLFGLILGGLRHRFSVKTSILCHVVFNAVVVLASVVL